MKISLIIPVHNAEKTLRRTIESVNQQDVPFDEIIVIDNNSTDNSKAIINEYIRYNKNIKYVFSDIAGVSHARNIGIRLATSEWLCFLDADDVLMTNNVLEIKKMLTSVPDVDVFQYNFIHHYENSFEVNKYILENGKYTGTEYVKENIISFGEQYKNMVWSYCYNKDFIQKNNVFFDEGLSVFEDILFLHTLFLKSDVKIFVSSKLLVEYMYNEASSTQISSKKYLEQLLLLTEKYKKLPLIHETKKYLNLLAIKILDIQDFKIYRNFSIKRITVANYFLKKVKNFAKKVIKKVFSF